MLTAKWLVKQFKVLFWEQMSEAVQQSNKSPYSLLIEANGLVVRGAREQEMFYSSTTNLHDFFVSHLPDLVSFDDKKLDNWAVGAVLFANKNSDHDAFVELFSSDMHYDVVLADAIKINMSTKFLKQHLRQTLGLKNVFVSDFYPMTFQALVTELAGQALTPTLELVASDIEAEQTPDSKRESLVHDLRVTKLRKEPSFRDVKGAIPFDQQEGLLRIAGKRFEHRAKGYRPVVERSLNGMQEAAFLQRVHNRDPKLVSLIDEYAKTFNDDEGTSAIILWHIGSDIDGRKIFHQGRQGNDDALDENDVLTINGFLLAHMLYIQCFDAIETLSADLARSSFLLQKISVAQAQVPWILLEKLGQESDIVEEKSGQLMQKAAEELAAGSGTHGAWAMGLGLLRGCLHAIGNQLLIALSSTTAKVASTLAAAGFLAALKQDGMYKPALDFLQIHSERLLQLSAELPHYFQWLRHLLELLGLS